jgi:hypothetical protein
MGQSGDGDGLGENQQHWSDIYCLGFNFNVFFSFFLS